MFDFTDVVKSAGMNGVDAGGRGEEGGHRSEENVPLCRYGVVLVGLG